MIAESLLLDMGLHAIMERGNRRQHKRLSFHFATILNTPRFELPIEGVTQNLSQGGALIKTGDWRTFQIDESAIVTLFLPPTFSGQDETIGLQGMAVVRRIDQEKEGVAVQFTESFKQFARNKETKILWQ